jgi:HPt (histidine-containing phosphotransfer) domain-containing protein
MNDFLAKPVEVEQLHQRLLHWLDRAPGAAPQPAAPARPGPALDDPLLTPLLALEGIDAPGGLAAVGGRVAVYRRLLTLFDGAHRDDARALQLALQGAAPGSAVRLAHRLRGAAATLGLVDIETAASALEQALEDGAAAVALVPRVQAVDEALSATLQRLRQALAA